MLTHDEFKNKDITFKYLAEIRDLYLSKLFFEEEYGTVVAPLIESFHPEKGIPLDLENPSDYYSSTTAIALLALHRINMISPPVLKKLHDSLLYLRDHTDNSISKKKSPEDVCAWDISESACVWSTVQSIRALLKTGYNGDKIEEVKAALLWVVDQQRPGGGWGFDITCKSRVFFTSLAINALKMGLVLDLTFQEKNRINKAISDGIQFIITESRIKGGIAYWTNAESSIDADATSTLYALWALHEHDAIQHSEVIAKGLKFIKKDLVGKDIWEMKEIVSETDTKYKSHKIIVSFTPAFPIILLKLGVSPFDEMCIKPMRWLKANRTELGWNLPGYSPSQALSFSSALALWTIDDWHKYVIREFLKTDNKAPFILIKLRKRITIMLAIIFGLTVIFNTNFIYQSINHLFDLINESERNISLIGSILTIIGLSVFSGLKYIDSNFLNRRISMSIKNIWRKINYFIYIK